MHIIISIAFITVLLSSALIVLRFGRTRLTGTNPLSLFTFISLLFTSGLDVGLIMFPLVEFPAYASEAEYQFTNPLAITFGSWGFMIWTLYFLTTFYFLAIEPKLQLFEIPWIKAINNIVVVGTCGFTGFLFLKYLPEYIDGIQGGARYALVAAVILCAVSSSTNIRYIKILGLSSIWMFIALIFLMWLHGGIGPLQLGATMAGIGDYFAKLHRFATPISGHHQFYLFWWVAWSIMIGQFIARFVGGLKVWQLLAALLVFPSIPLALWFTILYFHYARELAVSGWLNMLMVVVGTIFVVNSMDSLTRLYSENLGLQVGRFGDLLRRAGDSAASRGRRCWAGLRAHAGLLGKLLYVAVHWALLYGLTLIYQFTPMEIEWVGLVVIGIYAVVYFLVFRRWRLIAPR